MTVTLKECGRRYHDILILLELYIILTVGRKT